jgi:hypothetical protein
MLCNNACLLAAPFVLVCLVHIHLIDEFILDTTVVTPRPSRNDRVCVLVPVTSRKYEDWARLEDTPLYADLFASLKHTCEPSRFLYSIYIGYDVGDAFYDNHTTLWAMRQWAAAHLPFAHLVAMPCANPLQKPVPVMNLLSRAAYNDSCDFMYQVKDTTECLTPWTSAFVGTLRDMSPPLRGVVGPTCEYGNTAILTHDFVHRSHLDLFPTHYPAELTDWWADDWITAVYGPRNALRLAGVVVARRPMQVMRYSVYWGGADRLRGLIEQGRAVVNVSGW